MGGEERGSSFSVLEQIWVKMSKIGVHLLASLARQEQSQRSAPKRAGLRAKASMRSTSQGAI